MKPNRKEAADIVRGTRDSSKAGWWRAAPAESLSEHIDRLGRLESAADTIQSYQPLMIPGMLQTFQYAAAAIKATTPALPPEEVSDRADRRLKRIDSLGYDADRRAWFVMSEETLRRPVGGKAVLIEQLEHLLNVAALRPSVTLQVMPEASEGHPGLGGGFTMYRIGGRRVVFTETLAGSVITTRPEDIAVFGSAYDHVTAEALPPAASLELIDTARRTLCQEYSREAWSG